MVTFHDSVMRFGLLVLTRGLVSGASVLEVGSFNVNGTLKTMVMDRGPARYVGVDLREGPDVDRVCTAEDLPTSGLGQFDLVICTEMLEHAERWRRALYGVKASVSVGGHLLLTTRGPGFQRHDHPGDYWRFTPPELVLALTGFHVEAVVEDPDCPGVLMLAQRAGADPVDVMVPDIIHPEAAPPA